MGELKNLDQDDVLDIFPTFPLKPRFNGVYITTNNLEEDGNIVLSDNILSDVQYVIAVGPIVTDIQPGQKVILDMEKMMKTVGHEGVNAYELLKEVNLDLVDINGVRFALVNDRVIKTIDNR